jgi:hypothetical protein
MTVVALRHAAASAWRPGLHPRLSSLLRLSHLPGRNSRLGGAQPEMKGKGEIRAGIAQAKMRHNHPPVLPMQLPPHRQ